jgi:hypothetical protein
MTNNTKYPSFPVYTISTQLSFLPNLPLVYNDPFLTESLHPLNEQGYYM